MTELHFTLLSDGSSDQALIPLITWCLRQHLPTCAIESVWADLRRLPRPPRSLPDRIKTSVDLYPCDYLFVHRDAEDSRIDRHEEIQSAVASLGTDFSTPVIHVVPIRMTEAWLMFDEAAIRRAAGNPNGVSPLDLPRTSSVQDIPNPKSLLYDLLRKASGLTGRRLDKFKASRAVHRLAELIGDFSPLDNVPAFRELRDEINRRIAPQCPQS